MFTKQDSVFWWTLDNYVKGNDRYKNLSIDSKSKIEQGFRLSYYGIFQYQMLVGRGMQEIEPSSIQQISNYIVDNFDRLYLTIYKNKEEDAIDISTPEKKEDFLELIEGLIIPYINDHSFQKVQNFDGKKSNIYSLIMQLCFKSKYDINYKNSINPDKLYFSPMFPFLLTLLIVNPTEQNNIFNNVKGFFKPEIIENAYKNGRLISTEEELFLTSIMDLIRNEEDFNTFLINFTEDKWASYDMNTRFKLVFQLSKFTSILLKERINNLTMMEKSDDIYSLIEFYIPIIFRDEKEINKMQKKDDSTYFSSELGNSISFLVPFSRKDYEPQTIIEYYEDMKITKIKFDAEILSDFSDLILYSFSYMRLLKQTINECPIISDYFVEYKRIALVNSLKLFTEKNDLTNQEISCNYNDFYFRFDNLFLDSNTLVKIIEESKNIKNIDQIGPRYKILLTMISYLISLSPSIVKLMDYSLDDIIKYYIISFGPYKKTKLGYDKMEIKSLISGIKKTCKNIISKIENDKIKSNELNEHQYYSTIYLIDKLINFAKK